MYDEPSDPFPTDAVVLLPRAQENCSFNVNKISSYIFRQLYRYMQEISGTTLIEYCTETNFLNTNVFSMLFWLS